MVQAPKLELKQTLGLALTPELRQSLEILQYDSLRLSDFVHREIEANPILEFDPGWKAPKRAGGGTDIPKKAGPDFSEVDSLLRREETLQDHIEDQLSFVSFTGAERAIANHMAGCLNEAGYLTASLREIVDQLGCSEKEAEKVLKTLQEFDPTGVFARDLRECLGLQLAEQGKAGKPSLVLLDYLELVAARDYEALEQKTGLNSAELEGALAHLKGLDPKPGDKFSPQNPVQTRIPDVFVNPAKDGGFEVELNPETLPRILINETYSTSFQKKTLKKSGKDYLQKCKRRASWLKRALDQRAKTLLLVSECLVKTQSGFFKRGIGSLKPLTLSDIAAEADLHQSTVSRVIANKYLSYPRGIYPLRFFLSSGVGKKEGSGGVSSHAVKHRIKALIGTEKKDRPLSDKTIAEILKKEGIEISRRTVMKYRKALKIPSSFERRKLKP